MQFKLQETDQGQFEIIQTLPVVVGVFPSQEMARKVFDFLVYDYMETAPAAPKPTRAPAKLKMSDAPKVEEGGNVKPLPWTEQEISEAIERLKAGERIKDVAESFGKNWGSLRAKWANFKRHNKDALAEVLTQPEINDADHDDCRLCGKSFMPTPDSLDLCARCNRDT